MSKRHQRPKGKSQHGSAAPAIFITEEAESAMRTHAASTEAREVCGVLIGTWHREGQDHVIKVKETLRGTQAAEGAMSVTFTHDTWAHIYEEVDRRTDGARIVGWYHTHPGFGVFYSSHDLFIQQSFFDAPWQFGFLIDPTTSSVGVFTNVAGRVVPARDYTVGAGKRARVVRCHYAHEPVRQEPEPGTASASGDRARVLTLESQLVVARRRARLATWAACGLAALTIALLLLLLRQPGGVDSQQLLPAAPPRARAAPAAPPPANMQAPQQTGEPAPAVPPLPAPVPRPETTLSPKPKPKETAP